MNFCKECGSKLQKESNVKYVCDQCANIYYVNPKAGVGLILLDDNGDLILTRRAIDPRKGTLDFIGGFVDLDESLEQAVYREIKEEAGLLVEDIINMRYFGSHPNPYRWQERIIPVIDVFYIASLCPGANPQPLEEISAFETVKLSSLQRKDVAFVSSWKMIERLRANE